MHKILVSACLLGHPVRYNGVSVECRHPVLDRWVEEGRVVPICPEVAGGLPASRLPAEISGGQGGRGVLAGLAIVIDSSGNDLTPNFMSGAAHALDLVTANSIPIAILKEGSPSCGTNYTYDGTFTGRRTTHPGVTSEILQRAGIRVFSEVQLEEASDFLGVLEDE